MKSCWLWIGILLFCSFQLQAQNHDALNQAISFPSSRGTSYEILKRVTEMSGYLFIYNNETIDNDKKVKIPAGKYSLHELIMLATGEKDIQVKLIHNHILLYKAEKVLQDNPVSIIPSLPAFMLLKGVVRERETGDPVPYCAVSIVETGMGTVTNQNGQFELKLPDSLQHTYLQLSHIGYETQRIPAGLLAKNTANIFLDTRFVPLEAIIVNLVNPQKVVRDMLANRKQNYTSSPFYLTSFYREGVSHRKGFINLTEAVFQVYKAGYNNLGADQVKLLKMRTISNEQEKDTVVLKMKAGIYASLMLDLIKNTPDFLTLTENELYRYTKIDMTVTDEHWAHVIAFEQKPGINGPLYKGELYIDADNYALLNARFQIHPDYIGQAQEMLIARKNRNVEIIPQSAIYTVAYKSWNGKYYINHIRGDLFFKVKKKRRLLPGSTNLHTYFEMATCQIDTVGVRRFSLRQSLPTNKVFSETNFVYDKQFWEDFNIIMPEEKLSDAIFRIPSKIKESSMTNDK